MSRHRVNVGLSMVFLANAPASCAAGGRQGAAQVTAGGGRQQQLDTFEDEEEGDEEEEDEEEGFEGELGGSCSNSPCDTMLPSTCALWLRQCSRCRGWKEALLSALASICLLPL